MLTYTPYDSNRLPVATEKPWLLLLLAFVWLWPGIFGHTPWKPDEPFVTAVVQHFVAGGHWMLPTVAGQPYLEYAPLYYWLAALLVKLLSPWLLPLHDAARLATPLCMAIALAFAGGLGRELVGQRHGRSVVLILIGSLGLIVTGHEMNPVVAGFAGFAAALYGLVLTWRSPAIAGALLGAAIVVIFLSTNLLQLLLISSVALLLPAFSAWRNKNYAITLAMALLFALPLLLVWPWALYKNYPQVFALWWQSYALGPLQGFGKLGLFHELGYYPKLVLWYGWPAWPLAAWTLWKNRRYEQPVLQLPLLCFAVMLLLLTFSSRSLSEDAMVLLLPLALLAAVELDSLRRGASSFLNWFGLMAFGFFALLVWLGWAAMNFGWPERLARRAAYFSPYYTPQVSTLAVILAVIATALWVWAVTRRHLRGRQAVTNWAAGLTLFWGLLLTLWLPFLDAAKSYQPVVQGMVRALPAGDQCVAVERGQTMARISWSYYANLQLRPFQPGQPLPCRLWLQVRDPSHGLALPAGWQQRWQGNRARDRHEQYVLLQKQG
ncbi:ArnT family glycosyltransferase [Vogesella sp. GCM10023246]|uniref:Glycosyltransferase RgtA/B/C/D-like domain-containing protein n=1 Tax=Vogesella oryzagri TaxID=3160864 RepID=A0ABV1M036_9NEIS